MLKGTLIDDDKLASGRWAQTLEDADKHLVGDLYGRGCVVGSESIHQEGRTGVTAESSISLGNWKKVLSSCLETVPTFGLLGLRGKQVTRRGTIQQSEARELAAEESNSQGRWLK